ncbi:hypothetical protein ZOSMA_181G00220 [Zostera marina]|uniref:Protein OS-9 homolog n=1 Tax=Zostera marina TaxID=29655 RepID=A0A0K9PT09_ZOSMR|nr:hypothetical protein ZOSMA_181G00220 [Zostera marina]
MKMTEFLLRNTMEIQWFMFLSLFSAFFIQPGLADRVFSHSTEGMTFGRNSRDPKYTIEFHSVDSAFHTNKDLEAITMSNNEGKKFLCLLPEVEELKSLKSVVQHNTSNVIVGAERETKLKTPDELIMDVLKDTCLSRNEGWWYYELCYQKKLRQIHQEEDKIIQEFILGEFDHEITTAFHRNQSDISTLKDPRSKDASQRYHAHIYTNGTICDLTNEPRETEVRFVCSESPISISSIKEISTCKYAVTIQCPMLCKHPMFQQEKPTPHVIHCNVLPQEETKDLKMDIHSDENDPINITTNDDEERFATT